MVKSLTQISVKVQKGDCLALAGDLLAVGVFSDSPASSLVNTLNKKLYRIQCTRTQLLLFDHVVGRLPHRHT